MAPEFWIVLLAKMALTAAIVVSASYVAERSRPAVGALIATLPVSAGPALVFIALQHGAAFLEEATLAGLPASGVTSVYILVYAAVARRHGLLASLAAAYAAWAVVMTGVLSVTWSFAGVVVFDVLLYATTYAISRRVVRDVPIRPAPRRWWDVPARAAAVMTLVAVVMITGQWIGPRAAGTAALLPVVMTSLAVILHPRLGGPAISAIVGRTLPGMMGFTTGLAVVHLAAVPLGATAALLLGLAVCVAWNLALLMAMPRVRTPAPPPESFSQDRPPGT